MKLSEAVRDTVIRKFVTMDEAMLVLETDCSEALRQFHNGNRIYRGISRIDPIGFMGDSRVHVRRAANTLNYHTLLVDNDPAWEKFPKRSTSFICTGNKNTALDYAGTSAGGLYLVFPFDGTKIAAAGAGDFWYSFNKEISANKFNRLIKHLLQNARLDVSDESWETFYKNLTKLDEIAERGSITELMPGAGELKWMFEPYVKEMDNLGVLEVLRNFFKPRDHRIIKLSEIPADEEIWFSGKAAFISLENSSQIEKI